MYKVNVLKLQRCCGGKVNFYSDEYVVDFSVENSLLLLCFVSQKITFRCYRFTRISVVKNRMIY